MIDGNWIQPLKPGVVHTWLIDIGDPCQGAAEWEKLLSAEEGIRSSNYRFERNRQRFIIRRGILRQLLSMYIDADPADIAYHVNPYGKLSLSSQTLNFNLSSCQDMVVFAFALENEVGVDIERIHLLMELDRMVTQWFSSTEQAAFYSLPAEIQMEAFFHIWTQKEAFLKARGEGFSFPLHDFSVSVDPNKPGRILSIKGSAGDASHWQMVSHVPEACWRVAVCIQTETNLKVIWFAPDLVDLLAIVPSGKK